MKHLALLAVIGIILVGCGPAPQRPEKDEKQAGDIKDPKMQLAHIQLALKKANALAEKRLAELNDLRRANTMVVNKLKDELRRQKLANATLNNELKKMRVDLMELNSTLKAEVPRRVPLPEQLAIARKENNRLSDTIRRLKDQLQESQAEVQRLGKIIIVFREQLAEAEERMKELEARLAGGTDKKKVNPPLPRKRR